MARRKKGFDHNGWLVIDKPLGLTSTQTLGRVKYLIKPKKAGHGGTLDPLATGILPIALGEATKTVNWIMDGTKVYEFTVRWGAATDTEDAEGDVIATSDIRPTREQITAALPAFTGEIEQIPPKYSAIKIDGERAYDLARDGADVDMPARTVRIDALHLLDMPDPDHAVFQCVCGKGTYIRSLARDLAQHLGTVGHIATLRRTACGPFDEKDAISLEKLEDMGHSPADFDEMLPVGTALDGIPALALTEDEARRLALGQALALLPVAKRNQLNGVVPGDLVQARSGDRLVAVAELVDGTIRPVRVFNM